MVGYELITNWWVPWVLYGGATMVGVEVLVAMGLIAKGQGIGIMYDWRDTEVWVRRYRIFNGKLETYYTRMELPAGTSKWGVQMDRYAPPGTKSVYLAGKSEWGFTEEMPPAPCTVFMSPGMSESIDKMIETGAIKP